MNSGYVNSLDLPVSNLGLVRGYNNYNWQIICNNSPIIYNEIIHVCKCL